MRHHPRDQIAAGRGLAGRARGWLWRSGPDDQDYLDGRTIYRDCATCHGRTGQGAAGPALATVRETFPDCLDHLRWIELGSQAWVEQVGPTYGAHDTAVEGAMPGFGGSLSPTEIRQVALYERVRFGGGELDQDKQACGLD